MGVKLFENDDALDTFAIRKFYNWFYTGVVTWLDIAAYKALQRIEKAVELDTFVPVDSTVQYSSSAVDTMAIFLQVKIPYHLFLHNKKITLNKYQINGLYSQCL